jgi:hypothetical protein
LSSAAVEPSDGDIGADVWLKDVDGDCVGIRNAKVGLCGSADAGGGGETNFCLNRFAVPSLDIGNEGDNGEAPSGALFDLFMWACGGGLAMRLP